MLKAVLDFFDFSRLPFSKGLTPKDAFPTSSHTEALARLQYGIGSEDFLLLTGPVGVGKSVALLALIHSLDPNAYSPIYVRGNNLGEGELYKAILAALDRDPPRFTQPARRMFFSVVPELSRKPIAIIDDAQEVKDAALLALKSLTNFSSDSQTRITFILSGQPELRARLKLSQYHALKQRIRLFYHMQPMALEETCRYIDHQTRSAGAPNPLFSDAAKADIHRHADGIPRVVNTVCYRSIINATVKKLKVIDAADLFLEDPGRHDSTARDPSVSNMPLSVAAQRMSVWPTDAGTQGGLWKPSLTGNTMSFRLFQSKSPHFMTDFTNTSSLECKPPRAAKAIPWRRLQGS